MLKPTTLALALIIGFGAATQVRADSICDDVNAIAESWDEVATIIDQHQDDEWSADDIDALIDLVGTLHSGSSDLADMLNASDNQSQNALGNRLHEALAEVATLTTADDPAHIVATLDGVTPVMDQVTDDCDAHQ